MLAALVAVRQGGGAPTDAAHRLTATGSVPIDLALHMDGFAVLVAVLVGLVATCVQIYSTAYLRDDPRYPSYAALVSLFTSAMLLVVYSGDLIVLLVGWEVMGICSYFLVGHYWETARPPRRLHQGLPGHQARRRPLPHRAVRARRRRRHLPHHGVLGAAAAAAQLHHPTLVALLLLAGVAGKSAQFPLHTWLPDAMAGPTPVSALIHAATMVAAGVYFVARLLPGLRRLRRPRWSCSPSWPPSRWSARRSPPSPRTTSSACSPTPRSASSATWPAPWPSATAAPPSSTSCPTAPSRRCSSSAPA